MRLLLLFSKDPRRDPWDVPRQLGTSLTKPPCITPGTVVLAAQEGWGEEGWDPSRTGSVELRPPQRAITSPHTAAVFTFCLPSIIINSGSLSGGDCL